MFGVAVVDIAFARFGGAGGVGEVLVEMIDKMAAPDEMPAKAAMGDGNNVDVLVSQQGKRDDQSLVALATSDCAANQSLPEKVKNAVVRGAGDLHPGIGAEQGAGKVGFKIRGPQVALRQNGGRFWIDHAGARRWQRVAPRASPRCSLGGGRLEPSDGERFAGFENLDGMAGSGGGFDKSLRIDGNHRPGVVVHGHRHFRLQQVERGGSVTDELLVTRMVIFMIVEEKIL